jgi:hypothetical protein
MSLTIRQRLRLGFGSLVFLTVSIGLWSVLKIQTISESTYANAEESKKQAITGSYILLAAIAAGESKDPRTAKACDRRRTAEGAASDGGRHGP